MVIIIKDLIGQKFGRLTVIEEAPRTSKSNRRFKCRCDCGNEIITQMGALRSGTTKSCGCYHRDCAKIQQLKNFKKENSKITIVDNYALVEICGANKFSIIDINDVDKVNKYRWTISAQGYAFNQEDKILMHRLILNPKDIVDHINGNKLDNRKENLRNSTRTQNTYNKGMMSNNTSGATGVWWHKQINKWCAELSINGNKINKCFDSKSEAIKYRKYLEIKYFGEYAPCLCRVGGDSTL